MARLPLSKLSLRLRRAFEREHPKVQLDCSVANYLAAMLEDDEECDEDNIVEVWSAYLADLLEPEGACKELCLSVFKHLKGCEAVALSDICSTTTSPQLSRAGSLNQTVPTPAVLDMSISPSQPYDATEEVEGLADWLEKLSLSHYTEAAREWCSGMGAATVEEIEEVWEEFSEALNLKKLEHRRLKLLFGPLSEAVTPQARENVDEEEEAEESSHRWAPGDLSMPEADCGFFMSSCSSKRGELQTFGDPDNPYTILKELGHGMTATVYKCRRGDEIFAVKAIGLSRLKMQRDKEKALERLRRESAILFAMRHPHVVSLYDVHETFERRFLVMEFVDGGELIDEIDQKGPLPEHEARYVFLQIVLGLRYIHSKGVVHRDLKLENVLVDKNLSQPGLLQVKISDFGHSKLVNDGYSRPWSQVGTPNYWAPEVANASAGGYDERIDLWSLGVILYVLVEGVLPFPSRCKVPKLVFQEDCKLSHLARHLTWRLMQIKPEDRLSLDDCLVHPWVTNSSSGLVGHVVQLCESHCRHQRGERERCAVLPHDPKNVGRLRKKLQELTLSHKYPMHLRARDSQKEVAMCFRKADDQHSVDAAWQELLLALKPEFRGKLESREVAVDASAVCCEGRSSRQSMGFSEEKIHQQDLELEALMAEFPDNVEAATGSFAPAPRHLEVALKSGQNSLWLRLELPHTYPEENRPPELTHMVVQSQDSPWSLQKQEPLRSQIQDFIRDPPARAPPGKGLQMLVRWLQEQILDGPNGLMQPTEPSEPSPMQAELEPEKDPANEASDGSVPATPSTASRGVQFARISVIVHHHDEKMDEKGLASDRLRPSLRGKAFFPHLKMKFPQITGFLSFGKPALLLAEGPETDLHRLIAEANKFPKWWDVTVSMFDRQKAVDINTWRAFPDFRKIKTEDIDTTLKGLQAEHCRLYEDALVGTNLDPRKREKAEKARKSSKK